MSSVHRPASTRALRQASSAAPVAMGASPRAREPAVSDPVVDIQKYVYERSRASLRDFLQTEASPRLTHACAALLPLCRKFGEDALSNWDVQYTLSSLADCPEHEQADVVAYIEKFSFDKTYGSTWPNAAHTFGRRLRTSEARETFCRLAFPLVQLTTDYSKPGVLGALAVQPLLHLPSIVEAALAAPACELSHSLIENVAATPAHKRLAAVELACRTVPGNVCFSLCIGYVGNIEHNVVPTFERHMEALGTLASNEFTRLALVKAFSYMPPKRWDDFSASLRTALHDFRAGEARAVSIIERLAPMDSGDLPSMSAAFAALHVYKAPANEMDRGDVMKSLASLPKEERLVRAQAAFLLLPPTPTETCAVAIFRTIAALTLSDVERIAQVLCQRPQVPTTILREQAWAEAIDLIMSDPILPEAWQAMPFKFMRPYAAQFAESLQARYPEAMQALATGQWDPSNATHRFAAAFDFLSQPHAMKACSKVSLTWKTLQCYFDHTAVVEKVEFDRTDLAEIQFLAYETLRIRSQIIDPAIRHANEKRIPLMVVANVTYGGTALCGLVKTLHERYGKQVKYGMRVVFRKQPSTDAHGELNVLGDVFTSDDLRFIATQEPLMVVLDGVVQNEGVMRHPDAFRAFRNFADALNVERGTGDMARKQPGLDSHRFEPQENHSELMAYLKALYAGREVSKTPYQFAYGTLTDETLRTKIAIEVPSEDVDYDETLEHPPAFSFSEFARGGVVCFQVAVPHDDIVRAKSQGVALARRVLNHPDVSGYRHVTGYYDDHRFQNIILSAGLHGLEGEPVLAAAVRAAMVGLEAPDSAFVRFANGLGAFFGWYSKARRLVASSVEAWPRKKLS